MAANRSAPAGGLGGLTGLTELRRRLVFLLGALLVFLAGRPVAQQPATRQAKDPSGPTAAPRAAPAAHWVSRPLPTRPRALGVPRRIAVARPNLLIDLLAEWERWRLVPT